MCGTEVQVCYNVFNVHVLKPSRSTWVLWIKYLSTIKVFEMKYRVSSTITNVKYLSTISVLFEHRVQVLCLKYTSEQSTKYNYIYGNFKYRVQDN